MIFFITIILLFLTGCGAPEAGKALTPLPASGAQVPVAKWESTGNRMQMASCLMGDTLYYEVLEKEETTGYIQTSLFRESSAGSDAELLVSLENVEMLWYQPDIKGDLYLFYREEGESPQYVLRKQTAQGETVYEQNFDAEEEAAFDAVMHGAVSPDGEVCLAASTGEIYFFSPLGELSGKSKSDWDKESYQGNKCGLVNAGEQGIYAYQIFGETEISLRKADFSQNNLEKAVSVSVSAGELSDLTGASMAASSYSSIVLFDGYDMGILISDSMGLRQYCPEENTIRQLFLWGDSNVNLQGYMLDAVGVLPEENFYILARRSYEDVGYVRVGYQDAQELTGKQTITLGGIGDYEIPWEQVAEMVSSFNRQSDVWQVELKSYDSVDDFYMDLLRGQGPDLIHMYALDTTVLADKGVLEELAPYFAASDVVQEDDVLPSLLRAGTIGGKLLVVIPHYQISVLMVEKGTVEEEGWTPDDFLALAEANPDSQLLAVSESMYRNMILNTAIQADLGSYVDWQEGCHFDTPEFIGLLERIRELPIPPRERLDILSADYDYHEADWKQFTDKEYLVKEKYMAGLDTGMDEISFNGGIVNGTYAQIVGYPNSSAKPYFELFTMHPMGINSASGAKEGAWAFLEYILSSEYQSDERKTYFPARVDSFELYMEKTRLYRSDIDVSKEDRDFLRWMVENAYWSENVSCWDIQKIINEETGAVWEGDCSPEAAAQNIQNRVSLYLAE